MLWSGSPVVDHVGAAVSAARRALREWSRTSPEDRARVLRRFQSLCAARGTEIAELLCDETGKVMWDARGEAGLLGPKVDITLDASSTGTFNRVRPWEVPVTGTRLGRADFRPHGVMAVIGPYNFPAHLPNGHIVPALAMGNTVVFKPSDKAPATGQLLASLYHEALISEGAPAGVVSLVHGGADVAQALVRSDDVDGILFTGSWAVGRRILEASLDRPSRMVALEMGGNNPSVVLDDADLRQAAVETVRSAFISTGQRCTCTRRVIVQRAVADRFVRAVCRAAADLVVGEPRSDTPVFMGPIISGEARYAVLDFQEMLSKNGGEVLLRARELESPGGGWFLSPGIVRVDRFAPTDYGSGCDVEVFGPLVRVAVVDTIEQAIDQANATRFGLASAIFTKDRGNADRFLHESRAGCVNVNTGTAGASSKLPFGGIGLSGNHRAAGSFSVDYCAYPVASLIESGDNAPVPEGMRFEPEWLA